MTKKLLKQNYKKSIGYSAVIGAILTSMPLSTVNAEDAVIQNHEEDIVAEQTIETDRETVLNDISLSEDIAKAILLTYEALHTYEDDQEFIELFQIQSEQLLNKAEELHNQSEFDKANNIYALLIDLDVITKDHMIGGDAEELLLNKSDDEVDLKDQNEELKEEEENPDLGLLDEETNSTGEATEFIGEDENEHIEKLTNDHSPDNDDSVDDAESYYQEAMTAAFASQAWQAANEGYNLYTDDERLLEAVGKAGERMMIIGTNSHKASEFNRALEYYDEILNNASISTQLQQLVELNRKFAVTNSQVMSAEELYEESLAAPYASQAWELSLYGAEIYPNDNRFSGAITQAANRMMIIGDNNHQNGNLLRAIDYYDQLMETLLVPQEIREIAENKRRQAKTDVKFKGAEDLYQEATTARFASQAWNAATEGYSLYPNDSRFLDAVAQAANRMMIIGTTSHDSGDFSRATEYYDQLMSLSAVPANIQRQASIQRTQAESEQKQMSADDYYHEAMTARFGSQAWNAAIEGYSLYPNDSRFLDAIAKAGERIMTIGMDSHKSGGFSRALEYYNSLITSPEIPSSLSNQSAIFKEQAQSGIRFKTSDEYYLEATSASFASQAWAAATEGHLIFPNDKRFVKAIDQASRRMLTIGRSNHENKNYKTATEYYQLLLNQNDVSGDVKSKVQLLNGFSSKGKAIKAESVYITEIKSATFASQSWDIAVEAVTLYETNEKINQGLIDSAHRQMKLGRQYEKAGHFSRAQPYFDRVSKQTVLPDSIRKLATSYSRLTQLTYRPVVFIDAGHGGKDSGAYFGGVKEATLNLSTAKILQAELIKRGYEVVMSRETDIHLTLEERSTKANAHDIDILLSIHNNSMGGRGTASGIESFIHHRVPSGYGQERDRAKFLIDNPRIEDSLRLADYTHNQLIKQTGLNQRYVKGNNFHMVREPYLPSVLFELGFMDNPAELTKITQVSFHRQSALAIADGVDAYFKR